MTNQIIYKQVLESIDDCRRIGLLFKEMYKHNKEKLYKELTRLDILMNRYLDHAAVRLTEKEYGRLLNEPVIFKMFCVLNEHKIKFI